MKKIESARFCNRMMKEFVRLRGMTRHQAPSAGLSFKAHDFNSLSTYLVTYKYPGKRKVFIYYYKAQDKVIKEFITTI